MDNNNFQKRLNAYQENINNIEKLPTPFASIKVCFNEFNHNLIDSKNAIHNCTINVIPNDTLDTANSLKQQNFNPLVLNMADPNFAGGCWNVGAGAQEESIFYRSNYFKTLNNQTIKYPINDDVAVYSKNVTIFRDN
jgi:uncharacterized protein (TIGR02452 family)